MDIDPSDPIGGVMSDEEQSILQDKVFEELTTEFGIEVAEGIQRVVLDVDHKVVQAIDADGNALYDDEFSEFGETVADDGDLSDFEMPVEVALMLRSLPIEKVLLWVHQNIFSGGLVVGAVDGEDQLHMLNYGSAPAVIGLVQMLNMAISSSGSGGYEDEEE